MQYKKYAKCNCVYQLFVFFLCNFQALLTTPGTPRARLSSSSDDGQAFCKLTKGFSLLSLYSLCLYLSFILSSCIRLLTVLHYCLLLPHTNMSTHHACILVNNIGRLMAKFCSILAKLLDVLFLWLLCKWNYWWFRRFTRRMNRYFLSLLLLVRQYYLSVFISIILLLVLSSFLVSITYCYFLFFPRTQ